jgi:hypothetical protein
MDLILKHYLGELHDSKGSYNAEVYTIYIYIYIYIYECYIYEYSQYVNTEDFRKGVQSLSDSVQNQNISWDYTYNETEKKHKQEVNIQLPWRLKNIMHSQQ